MTRWIVLAPLVLLVAGCTTGDGETRTKIVSVTQNSDGVTHTVTTRIVDSVVPGVRGTLSAPGAFYSAQPDELCAIARSALLFERDRGRTAPVEGLFYDDNIAIGPDCTGVYLAAGLRLAAPGAVETRHVSMPRQAANGRVTVGVDYGCAKQCLGGADYAVDRRGGEWRIDPNKTTTWIR